MVCEGMEVRDWCFDVCRAGGFLLELAFGPRLSLCERGLILNF